MARLVATTPMVELIDCPLKRGVVKLALFVQLHQERNNMDCSRHITLSLQYGRWRTKRNLQSPITVPNVLLGCLILNLSISLRVLVSVTFTILILK